MKVRRIIAGVLAIGIVGCFFFGNVLPIPERTAAVLGPVLLVCGPIAVMLIGGECE